MPINTAVAKIKSSSAYLWAVLFVHVNKRVWSNKIIWVLYLWIAMQVVWILWRKQLTSCWSWNWFKRLGFDIYQRVNVRSIYLLDYCIIPAITMTRSDIVKTDITGSSICKDLPRDNFHFAYMYNRHSAPKNLINL